MARRNIPTYSELTRREKRNVRMAAVAVVVAVAVFATLAIIGVRSWQPGWMSAKPGPSASPTPVDQVLYVSPEANAVRAAAEDSRSAELAAIPTARWLSSWSTVETAEEDTSRYVDGASEAGEVPVLVLYQIPDRDCGLYASGGLEDASEYLAWVDEVAKGLLGHSDTLVIIEPDALPMTGGDCNVAEERLAMLDEATTRIAATGARVYIDAGHSDWIDAATMAERLVAAGVESARGFSTNVSNFRLTEDEIAYAEQVRAELFRLGVEDVHYVIDTSRNGAVVPDGDVCNPLDARIGEEPQLYTGSPLDAVLWVKAPGEPDGPCNGAPTDDPWWPEGALNLMGEES